MASSHKGESRATEMMGLIGLGLLTVAFLLPVGDAPWFSFWREWAASIAAVLLVLGGLSTLRDGGRPLVVPLRSVGAVALALAALVWLQWAAGLVPYHSDAAIVSLLLVGFASCVAVAASLSGAEREQMADRLAICMLVAASISAPLGVLQWLGWLRLDMGMPVAGGRPVAHMEQANLFCSLLIQGVLGAWRLVARKRLQPKPAGALCVLLLLGIVLTQSRIAWLAAATIVVVVLWRRALFANTGIDRAAFAAVAVVALGALLLPWFDTQFGLKGASLAERVSGGRRPAAWALFVDAALARPWAGWGVLQNGAAQFALADRHPSLAYVFSSAHNVVLDLVIWFGIPVGLLAGLALLLALGRRVARATDLAAMATALAAVMLVLHGMVELPLHYAYFLLPLGFYLGLTANQSTTNRAELRMPVRAKALLPVVSLCSLGFLALLGSEYIRITDIRPIVAYDRSTSTFMLESELPLPDVVVLDQLRAFHAFAALPIATGRTPAELTMARQTMLRAPFRASIERYALLAGLNGRADDARDALSRLCKFETAKQCDDSRRVWSVRRHQWPVLPIWPDAPAATATQ